MSIQLPVLKGKLGSTTYYLMLMSAGELVKRCTFVNVEEWSRSSLAEKYQRQLDYNRIKRSIVPFLKKREKRFMGSIIVANKSMQEKYYQPLSDVSDRVINKYFGEGAGHLGVYHLDEGDELVILDGQHRVKALEEAIKQMEGEEVSSLEHDQIAVIMIEFSRKKARELFTVVNNNAKRTTTSETLITDDGLIPVLTRDVAENILGIDKVEHKVDQLSKTDKEFTTLPTIAYSTKAILREAENLNNKMINKHEFNDKDIQRLKKTVKNYWEYLIHNFEPWFKALQYEGKKGEEIRVRMRAKEVSIYPITIWSVMEAVAIVTNQENYISIEEAVNKLNKLPWKKKSRLWDRVLVNGEDITNKRSLVTRIILFILNDFKCDSQKIYDKLLLDYKKVFPNPERIKLENIKKLANLR